MLDDGRPLRSVEAAEWFVRKLSFRVVRWSGHGILMLLPRRGAHSIWLFWDDDASFRSWYVNLEQPHLWHDRGCDTRDELLDLTCERPREWRWKDEDELETAVAAAVVSRERAAEIRAEGERVGRLVENWASPFADGWERWLPSRDWALPSLPPDWDRP